MFGASLADTFQAPAYDCRVIGADQQPEFAVTRLRSGPRVLEKAPAYARDEAILICLFNAAERRPVARPLRRAKRRGCASHTFRGDIFGSQLPVRNVDPRALQLSALLSLKGTS
jgi:hypothetical protein